LVSIPPLLFALLIWFIGTAAIVWLDSRPRATFRTSLTLAGLVAIGSVGFAWGNAGDPGPGGAYVAFTAAITVWAWHEMSFLMGAVTGPSHRACPTGATGWQRFRAATATVIYHELAIAGTVCLLFAVTWGEPNQVAPRTFALLFALRLSAKFNLFLGVPNLSDEIFPAHLAYLKSYFRHRAMNPLFPFSILFGGGIAVWAWSVAEAAPADSGAAAGASLIAGLAALGVVEHLFLVLPLRDATMWRWASSTKRAAPAANTD
jgi:putative photosynthetic complex assembly protein 2